MSHLGRWLSALVDNELDDAERDRVLNHLAGCHGCRQEANALRALKRRMTALGDTSDDATITGRLIERARFDQEILASRADRSTPWPSDGRYTVGGSRQIWPNWRIATGSAGTALVAIGVLAFLLGGSQAEAPAPKITPAVDTYWMQHSYDTGQAPAVKPAPVATVRPPAGGDGFVAPALQVFPALAPASSTPLGETPTAATPASSTPVPSPPPTLGPPTPAPSTPAPPTSVPPAVTKSHSR